jgi:hypothetical protein
MGEAISYMWLNRMNYHTEIRFQQPKLLNVKKSLQE